VCEYLIRETGDHTEDWLSEMKKILVLTDAYLTRQLWEKGLRDALGNLYDSQEFRYLELRMDSPSSMKWSTEPVKGVREAAGDLEQVEREVGNAEILVVHFAPITADVMDADKNLRLISSARGGPVNVDVEAATKRGIIVTATIGRLAPPVADHTIGLLLAEVRHIARDHAAVMDGSYFASQDPRRTRRIPVQEMEGKTIGIIGFGQVGREVAKRARGFDLTVLAFDPYVDDATASKYDAVKVDLETLLKKSDFISINARESPETYHLLGKKQFTMMKPTAYVVNTSRGSIIDEKALVEALQNNQIAGAGIDVFEEEPLKKDNPLLRLKNVTITPHTAGGSDKSTLRSVGLAAGTVARYIKGEKFLPGEVFNPSVLEK